MKAAWYERNGPANSVLILGDKPTPKPTKNEVLVKLATSGVNPSDVKSRAARPLAGSFVIPHSDGAGVVEAVGEGVADSIVGQRVWIWNGQWQRPMGTAAEYISVPQSQAVVLDDDVDFSTAACFGIPGLTAAHAVNMLEGSDAETVLVTGAASSVGHYVTQMLSQSGRRVIGTASSKKHKIVTAAGAAAAVDYHNEDVGAAILEHTDGAGVDAVIDMDFSSTSLLIPSAALAPHSTIYCYGSNDMGELGVPFRDLLFKSITLKFFLVYDLSESERMSAISRLEQFLISATSETRIGAELPLDEIVKAHELVESGKATGNVVIKF